eukprot:Seg1211.3 transcript_id=Seg1211.3/GoldUCD/mRNA.D3Y31 product="Rhodopsin GQ-coupled" protein_id=Seg1211.3/GoldUCD/D3Y31
MAVNNSTLNGKVSKGFSSPNVTDKSNQRISTAFTKSEYALIAIAVSIIILNTYVASLFARKRKLRRNSSLFLLSLTLADLFTGVITVPLLIASTPLQSLGFEETKLVYIFGDIMTVFSASLIILSLCAITADRYARLCHPIKHMTMIHRTRVITLFLVIWISALLYSMIPFAWLHNILMTKPRTSAYAMVDNHDLNYSVASAFIFAIPTIGLTIAFTSMFYAIHKLGQNERKRSLDSKQEYRYRKRERKAVIIFSLMFVVFLICWAPWIILRPIFDKFPAVYLSFPPIVPNILMLIRFLSSIVNPLLYTMHEYEFRRAFHDDRSRFLSFVKCNKYNPRHGSFSGATTSFPHRPSFLKSELSDSKRCRSNTGPITSDREPMKTHQNGHLHPNSCKSITRDNRIEETSFVEKNASKPKKVSINLDPERDDVEEQPFSSHAARAASRSTDSKSSELLADAFPIDARSDEEPSHDKKISGGILRKEICRDVDQCRVRSVESKEDFSSKNGLYVKQMSIYDNLDDNFNETNNAIFGHFQKAGLDNKINIYNSNGPMSAAPFEEELSPDNIQKLDSDYKLLSLKTEFGPQLKPNNDARLVENSQHHGPCLIDENGKSDNFEKVNFIHQSGQDDAKTVETSKLLKTSFIKKLFGTEKEGDKIEYWRMLPMNREEGFDAAVAEDVEEII